MKTVKTLYRAHSVLGVHQHLQRVSLPRLATSLWTAYASVERRGLNALLNYTCSLQKMYPMPPEIAADVQPKAKENQRYGWHLQHSYDEDVWPKLIHYRVSEWGSIVLTSLTTFEYNVLTTAASVI